VTGRRTALNQLQQILALADAGLSQQQELAVRYVLSRTLVRLADAFALNTNHDVAWSCLSVATGGVIYDDLRQVLEHWTALLRTPYGDPRATSTTNWIAANYGDAHVSLATAAARVHVSKSALTRLLERHTGVSFSIYLHHVRVDKAQALLRSSVMSVKEIAAAVGYDSTRQLDRHFRRQCHMTPSQFRLSSD
jgi:transcriptional regulator GlxA family with amidase domain